MKRLGLLIILFIVSVFMFAQNKTDFKYQKKRWENQNFSIVFPTQKAGDAPWLLKFDNDISLCDSILLEKGFHIVSFNYNESNINNKQLLINDFYKYISNQYQLSNKLSVKINGDKSDVILKWAFDNPEIISSIYIESLSLKSDELQNLEINLTKLKNLNIPIIGKNSTSDDNNSIKLLYDLYSKLGGIIQITNGISIDEEKQITDSECIADFIVRNREEYKKNHHITFRSDLNNSFYRFHKEKEGCVAFLGGSITEMIGWRNMIKASLQQRFPDTKFKFIEVGIGSTGTTPHAFRFENDVLKQGIPDLMFVEAAVNDNINGFGPKEQVRGMEGIVRNALQINPNMDIIMMHFIYAPFIKPMQIDIIPDVVMNHERVANYYKLSSINLVQEIVERMDNSEFTWEDFGGTHPVWEGHKYYAAAINYLFDINSSTLCKLKTTPHYFPTKPIDKFSYENGHFIDIKEAKSLNGFNHIKNWNPKDKDIECRKGFVDVPMLEAKKAGSSLILDFIGKAVGIFCVSGPNAGILEYSIDDAPYKELDTYTVWSNSVFLPWVYMFETELDEGKHRLHLKIKDIPRTECLIRNFVVNGSTTE